MKTIEEENDSDKAGAGGDILKTADQKENEITKPIANRRLTNARNLTRDGNRVARRIRKSEKGRWTNSEHA